MNSTMMDFRATTLVRVTRKLVIPIFFFRKLKGYHRSGHRGTASLHDCSCQIPNHEFGKDFGTTSDHGGFTVAEILVIGETNGR